MTDGMMHHRKGCLMDGYTLPAFVFAFFPYFWFMNIYLYILFAYILIYFICVYFDIFPFCRDRCNYILPVCLHCGFCFRFYMHFVAIHILIFVLFAETKKAVTFMRCTFTCTCIWLFEFSGNAIIGSTIVAFIFFFGLNEIFSSKSCLLNY